MRTVRVIFGRTLGTLLRSMTTAFSVAGFLALAGGFFVYALARGDGGTTPVAAIWSVAAVPFLPVLAALLTMRLVADARASGRLDLLLTAPILERDVVIGKYLGAFAVQAAAVGLYLLVPLSVLPAFATALRGEYSAWSFLPAVAALLLQSVLWCAVGLFASASARHAAAAVFASLLIMLALPHAAFEAATAWFPVLRARLAAMPFEAHIVDFSTGLVRLSMVMFYGVLAAFALFAATKTVARARLRGRAGRGLRWSTRFVVLLAFVFSCLVVALAIRLDVSVELPMGSDAARMSHRTRQILSEAHGDVRVTCFLARKAPEFRAVARLLHGLEGAAEAVAGVRLAVDYVDPRWDFGRAADLVRRGREEGSLVFRRGNREVTLAVRDLFAGGATNGVVTVDTAAVFAGEGACASALRQLAMPFARETVYWTTGHGETPFDSYDPLFGMSDIAREMRRDGYALKPLDLAGQAAVPEDCAAVVVAGAREPFSRTELARLDGWMRAGGRLLVLAAPGPNAGVGAYLATLGVRILPFTVVSPRSFTGQDVIVRDFSEHEVMRPLAGGTAVFESPVALAFGAQVAGTTFTELARTDASAWGESEPAVRPWVRDAATEPAGPLALAVAVERGGGLAKEIALRPTRLVVVGDATFVSNGALARRANANRDVFLNALAWLVGVDAVAASRAPGNLVAVDMERAGWTRFVTVVAGGFPAAVFALWALVFLRRRRSP